jgi:hypothetical protein
MRAVVGVAITPGICHRNDLNDVTDHWVDLA